MRPSAVNALNAESRSRPRQARAARTCLPDGLGDVVAAPPIEGTKSIRSQLAIVTTLCPAPLAVPSASPGAERVGDDSAGRRPAGRLDARVSRVDGDRAASSSVDESRAARHAQRSPYHVAKTTIIEAGDGTTLAAPDAVQNTPMSTPRRRRHSGEAVENGTRRRISVGRRPCLVSAWCQQSAWPRAVIRRPDAAMPVTTPYASRRSSSGTARCALREAVCPAVRRAGGRRKPLAASASDRVRARGAPARGRFSEQAQTT